MCTTEPSYFEKLSLPSVQSLEIQGGLMNEEEIWAFEQHFYAQDAVQLRKWDDLAKDPDWQTEPIETFVDIMSNVVLK